MVYRCNVFGLKSKMIIVLVSFTIVQHLTQGTVHEKESVDMGTGSVCAQHS